MRKTAQVPNDPKIKRAMLYQAEEGVYVFLFDAKEDAPCFADYLEENLAAAEMFCEEQYDISVSDWQTIPDSESGYYHYMIRPVTINPQI